MASYTLSTIISKFLKQIGLTQDEKDGICEEIGALKESQTSEGAEGDEDSGKLAQYGSLGQLGVSDHFKIYGGDGTGCEAFMQFEGFSFSISSHRAGNYYELLFPDGSFARTVYLPDYDCTIIGAETSTGQAPLSVMPNLVTVRLVADEAERLDLDLDTARNRIVWQQQTINDIAKLYVFNDGATLPSDPDNWWHLSDSVTLSFGGNGATDYNKAPAYDITGGITGTFKISARAPNGLNTLSLFCNNASRGLMHSSNDFTSIVSFPTLNDSRSWDLPAASGTIALSEFTVSTEGDQDINGIKTFFDPINCANVISIDGTFNGQLMAPNQTVASGGDEGKVLTKYWGDVRHGQRYFGKLTADHAGVTSSTFLVDTDITFELEPGSWEITVFAPLTCGTTGGAKISLGFTGTTDLASGTMEIGNNGATSTKTTITNANVFGDFSKTGTTDAVFEGRFMCSAVDGGYLTLRYAQSVSNGTPTVMKAGAYVIARYLELPPDP